ncbi:MAG: aspartate carbamoyltransferase [Spirochaetaceae bacterium]|jgi:aspartate carbamoyltransferase|nr:aspartate carbamoyltransferase [Spirochaetaceae bacterium]
MSDSPFKGRSIAVVNDLSKDEQLYLYKKTTELKERYLNGDPLEDFRLNDAELGCYLFFLEDSTRTKESFRNAALFHGVKLINFDVSSSSVKKSESLMDTIKMLFGYSQRSLFLLRTPQEGVCKALDETLEEYAKVLGKEKPAFINGGDGKHEHPTQEFLDEFSFLEQKKWDNREIHILLTGDLFHGRTVHSKADGLTIFDRVKIDLVAPKELALPEHYRERMVENGFTIREFESIDKYLDQKDIAPIWYFTRLQLERMGDEVREKAAYLRRAVTFRKDFLEKIPQGTKFYHPLPRHRETPTIPSFLDSTELNGWDVQSMNGFFTRVIEIAMVTGKLGGDFNGNLLEKKSFDAQYIEEIKLSRKTKVEDRYKVGIKPVDRGIVIDHIGRGESLDQIWTLINRIRKVLGLNYRSSHGVYHCSDTSIYKGIISLPDIFSFEQKEIKMLAALAPECTLNFIEDQSVIRKLRLHMPPRIYNFSNISCKNENCITHPLQFQNVNTRFHRHGETFVCSYCEKSYSYTEIWDE